VVRTVFGLSLVLVAPLIATVLGYHDRDAGVMVGRNLNRGGVRETVAGVSGPRDGLRSHRREWNMTFVASGEQALAALASSAISHGFAGDQSD
jgi:hypothetical protein